MSVNTGLDLKTRFALEKMKRIKISEISSVLVQFFLCAFLFFASDNFQGTFVDFRFMMFSLDERIGTYLNLCPKNLQMQDAF